MRIARGISITNLSKPISTAIVYDADAVAFFTAASITDTTQKSAVNQLVLDLKAASIWTKMKALYPIVGGVASSHAVNLKTPGTYNLSFATGWTHSSTGMTPNGATYANTSLIPSTALTLNSTHISYYSRTTSNGAEVELGNGSLANSATILEIRTSGITYYRVNSDAPYISHSDSDSRGHYIANRTASNIIKGIKNGNIVASGSTVSGALLTTSLYLGSSRDNTLNPVLFSTKQCAFASIGDGLTDAEASSFYTAVQNYQTTLGRQV